MAVQRVTQVDSRKSGCYSHKSFARIVQLRRDFLARRREQTFKEEITEAIVGKALVKSVPDSTDLPKGPKIEEKIKIALQD